MQMIIPHTNTFWPTIGSRIIQYKNARRHTTTFTTVDESKSFKNKHRQNRIHLFWSL